MPSVTKVISSDTYVSGRIYAEGNIVRYVYSIGGAFSRIYRLRALSDTLNKVRVSDSAGSNLVWEEFTNETPKTYVVNEAQAIANDYAIAPGDTLVVDGARYYNDWFVPRAYSSFIAEVLTTELPFPNQVLAIPAGKHSYTVSVKSFYRDDEYWSIINPNDASRLKLYIRSIAPGAEVLIRYDFDEDLGTTFDVTDFIESEIRIYKDNDYEFSLNDLRGSVGESASQFSATDLPVISGNHFYVKIERQLGRNVIDVTVTNNNVNVALN
jgi:hypothetical protein